MRRGIKKKTKKIKNTEKHADKVAFLKSHFNTRRGFDGAIFFSPLQFGNDSSSKWHLSSLSSQLLTTTNLFFFVMFD